jgi:uncharacterized glyoxalase superfamily protein PhnB
MANQTQSEQLDKVIERLLGSPDAPLSSADASHPFDITFAPVIGVIRDLRNLPRPDFKTRLKADLERSASMATAAEKPVNFIREGFHTITPYLVISGAAQWIDFVKQAFGAEEHFRAKRPGAEDVIMHAEVKIGDSMVELADANPQFPAMPCTLLLRVDDPDAVYNRALEAGATVMQPIADAPYGSRGGTVLDVAGNRLHISKPVGAGLDIFKEFRSVTPHLYAQRPADLIEFLQRAFGGEETYRAEMPDGSIPHAQVRIGDSIVALAGEQALRAGATSIQPPADQPYGDRSAGVTDPFGNRWFIATHIRDVQM